MQQHPCDPPHHNRFGWEEVPDSSAGGEQGHLAPGTSCEPEHDSQLDFVSSVKSGGDQLEHKGLKVKKGHPQKLKEKRNS